MPFFTLLPHTADIKIRVTADSLENLFKAALQAMFCCMRPSHDLCCENFKKYSSEYTLRPLYVESGDLSTLLVDFLSDALSSADIYDEAYFEADINLLTDTAVNATLKGVKVEGYGSVEIKAVTYNDIKVEKTADGWVAEIVFDI